MATFFVGDTRTYILNAWSNGAPWSLVGATVTFFLKTPQGTIMSYVATVAGAQAAWVDEPSSLIFPGAWKYWFTVSQGSVFVTSPAITFSVNPVG